jgi:hypothetical protein
MSLAADTTILAVQHAIETTTLMTRDGSIGFYTRLCALNLLFPAFQMPGFAGRQRAVSDSAPDASLLPLFTPVYAGRFLLGHILRPGCYGKRQSARQYQ